MLFVDYRVGSESLLPLLIDKGLPAIKADIGYADVEFVGRGVKGEQVLVGVECKRLSELTGDWDRFAGEQVPKMNREYQHRYLVFEGEWHVSRNGLLERRTGRGFKPFHGDANASRLRKKLVTLEMCGGFHIQHVSAEGRKGSWSAETVRYLHDLYRWWTDDDMDQHKSHVVNYQAQGLIPLNKFEHAFAAWPGLSSKRAKPVAKRFHNSIRLASSASVEEWASIEVVGEDGKVRKLGTKMASGLVRFLNGDSE